MDDLLFALLVIWLECGLAAVLLAFVRFDDLRVNVWSFTVFTMIDDDDATLLLLRSSKSTC